MKQVFTVSAALLVGLFLSRDSSAADGTPTFAKDVAPILYSKCVTCHRPGEVAPMPLIEYQNVRPWARSIKQKIVAREMPPWFADRHSGKFKNDPTLSDQQIATIVAWVDAGAPKGEDKDLPPAPKFAKGWAMGTEPDAFVEMPIDFELPAEGEIENPKFWTRNPFTEDKFAEAVEMRPGNPAVVHHADGLLRVPCNGCTVDENGEYVYPDGTLERNAGREQRQKFDTDSTGQGGEVLFIYLPGYSHERHLPGTGKLIPKNAILGFGMHYQPSGKPETDRTKFGLWWSKGPVTKQVYNGGSPTIPGPQFRKTEIAEGKEIVASDGRDQFERRSGIPNIPPYAENWKLVQVRPVPVDITVTGFKPHMHLRGKDWKWVVTYPDGRSETLLAIPQYNFHWQLMYNPEAPIKIPAGSTLTAIARWDNTASNPYNPAPDKEVFWSEQSWDEMMTDHLQWTIDAQDLSKGISGRPAEQSRQQR